MPFPIDSINDLVNNYKDIISNIIIGSVWGGARYLNDLRSGKETYKTSMLILSIIISWSLGFGLYWIISWVFWITNQALISSISFVIGMLSRELINTIVKISPELLTTFIPNILHLLINKWKIEPIAIPIESNNSNSNKESKPEVITSESNNNLPDA